MTQALPLKHSLQKILSKLKSANWLLFQIVLVTEKKTMNLAKKIIYCLILVNEFNNFSLSIVNFLMFTINLSLFIVNLKFAFQFLRLLFSKFFKHSKRHPVNVLNVTTFSDENVQLPFLPG